MQENNSNRIGVYINNELLARCDAAMEKTNAESRSEFIREAIEHYIAVLNMKESSRVLTPALESVVNSRISMTEDRISRLLFKLGVEVAMMGNIIAATYDIDEDSLSALRRFCTNEVAAIGGKYSFEDAVEFQNG
ncbi:CopG family ribbon-helix-helix protein [Oscillospiraceae bacterium HCP3S3_D12]